MSRCSENAEKTCKSYPNCDGCNAYGNSKNLTDEQIMKALECHNICRVSKCEECPLFPTSECSAELSGYAIDLVNRKNAKINQLEQNLKEAHIDIKEKQAEIESLRKAILDADYSSITALKAKQNWHIENSEYIRKLNEENDKLTDMYYSMQSTLAKMSMGVEEAKAEAIKEFAERLKERTTSYYPIYSLYVSKGLHEAIDNLVKEMVGDTE